MFSSCLIPWIFPAWVDRSFVLKYRLVSIENEQTCENDERRNVNKVLYWKIFLGPGVYSASNRNEYWKH
jgi:hypothetical protein